MAMKGKKQQLEKGNSRETGELKRKDYEQQLERLHVELVKAQQWIVHKGLKICVVFEGRDGAGKGGTIKAITERVSPRIFRVVALQAPTAREKKPDVRATIPSVPPRCGGSRHLRPQLVQPRGSRARDGVLHRSGRQAFPAGGPGS